METASASSDQTFAIVAFTAIIVFVYDKFTKAKSPKAPTVRQLYIYPIKSCSEMNLLKASVTARGFRYDRSFQVVSKTDNEDKVWMFCTPRNKAFQKLFHLRPSISVDGKCLTLSSYHDESDIFSLELDGAANSSLVSKVMGYNEFLLEDYGDDVASWIGRATGIDAPRLVGIPQDNDHPATKSNYNRRVKVNPDQGEELPLNPAPIPVSLADEAPFLLTTRESLVALNQYLKRSGKDEVDMRRFRPNIVIDGLKPWEEDTLKRIRIGSTEFHVWQRCGRCVMTTIDRDTLHRCGEPMNTLSTFRERVNGQRNFGMHLIPVVESEGRENENKDVAVGDEVEILEYDEERRAEWVRLFDNGNRAT